MAVNTKDIIEQQIDDWFNNEIKKSPSEEVKLLFERIHDLVRRGGKRMRPELLFMTYAAYGGKQANKIINLGLALEFHHQFLLVHDDIMDDDVVRYDGPNIVGFYIEEHKDQKQNIPLAMGLLAGDMLFSFANQLVVNDQYITDQQKVQLLEFLNDTNIKVAYGQLLDVFNVEIPEREVTEERLLLTHSLKSATYSIQLPMRWAAILCDLSQEEVQKIDDFALPFGLLFQLVDDYSDYFMNTSAFNNRPKYRDFSQGKITYPLYIALQRADPSDVIFLKKHIGNKNITDITIDKIIAILEKCGAKEESRAHLQKYIHKANLSLDKLSMSPEYKQKFQDFIKRFEV